MGSTVRLRPGEWIKYRSSEINSDFLRYAFFERDFREKFLATKSGVGGSLTRARPAAVAEIEILLPPRAEQKSIVAKLDRLSARSARAREELARIPRLVAHYKQAILAAAFRGDLSADWRATEKSKAYQEVGLLELLREPVRNGLSVRGSDDPPGVRALRLSALRTAVVDVSDVRYLPITDIRAQKYLLEENDVLISRGNGNRSLVGISSLVPELKSPTIFPDTAFRIRLNSEKASPGWFTYAWSAPQIREQVEGYAKTTAGIWKVAQSDIANVKILLPEIKEQLKNRTTHRKTVRSHRPFIQ